jgi:hypothetical protein
LNLLDSFLFDIQNQERIRRDAEGESGEVGEFESVTSFVEIRPEEVTTTWPCDCAPTTCTCVDECDVSQY